MFKFNVALRPQRPQGLFGTTTPTFTHLLSSDVIVQVQCCFMSTETAGTISDGEPTSTFTQLLNSDMIVQVQCCFTSTETIRAITSIRDGEPRKATSTFTQLLNSDMIVQVQCCFTSTETIRAITSIRDGEPRKATSTFTQLLNSASKRGLNNLYLNYKPAFPLNPCRRFC